MTARRILYVVDDEAVVRASIVSLVQAHGDLECREYRNGDIFLADCARGIARDFGIGHSTFQIETGEDCAQAGHAH